MPSVLLCHPQCITNREGSKVTAYHFVSCPCDCTQYRHSPARNQCVNCKHFHGATEKPLNWSPVTDLTIPALSAAVEREKEQSRQQPSTEH